MDFDEDYDPPKGLIQALMDGKVDEVTRILKKAGDRFPLLAYIYGRGVKDTRVLGESTALTLVTDHGHLECVRQILLELGHDLYAFGVELDEGDSDSAVIPDDYFAALLIAFSKGHSEICQLLVEFRLFEVPGVADSYAEFITAMKQSDFLRVESLLDEVEEKDIFLKGWRGHNIMNLCLLFGCPRSCLKKMLDLGIGVNGWDYNGLTPLMCAIIGKNLTCVQFLLDKGAEPYAKHLKLNRLFLAEGTVNYEDITDSSKQPSSFMDSRLYFGPSALMYAAAMGNIPILKLMLKAAPKDVGTPSAKHVECSGSLMFSIAYANNIEAVGLVLEYSAATDYVDYSPMLLAMQIDDIEVFDLLLEKIPPSTWKPGVLKATADTCMFKNYLYLAKLTELTKMDFLDMHGGDSLFQAIGFDRLDLIEVLVKLPGFNVHSKYSATKFGFYPGVSCFMYACFRNRYGLAEFFLAIGADVNIVDEYLRTPVMNAVRLNDVQCLKFLIKANADLDIKDLDGGTVFSAALMGDGVCLEFLLQTKELFEDDGKKLKSVHRESASVCFMFPYHNQNVPPGPQSKTISFRTALIVMQYKIFEWDWCIDVDGLSLWSVIFGAVSSGLSPGKIAVGYENHEKLSPLAFVIRAGNKDLFRYLVANLYFLPSDYQYLLNFDCDNCISAPSFKFLREQLISQPLTLQAWSVLHISQSLVNSSDGFSFPYDRSSKVDALPLPDCLKDVLKFKTKFSNLCIRQWKYLGPQSQSKRGYDGINDVDITRFDEIVFEGARVGRFTLEKCTEKNCVCQGFGQKVSPVSCQQKNFVGVGGHM